MAANVRRRVIRPPAPEPLSVLRHQERQRKQQARLAKEREIFDRWMVKLRRAFHTVERSQRKIARLERDLARHDHNGVA